ncbi:MAG: hypothetical protein VKN72_03585 [Nostocales cyanobacterium 94392]|nr:hypothetical protein [Nostocales cyanobacterium 94392]
MQRLSVSGCFYPEYGETNNHPAFILFHHINFEWFVYTQKPGDVALLRLYSSSPLELIKWIGLL